MNLLVCTQAVDRHDPLLGFFHQWLAAFGTHGTVTALALRVGEHQLPESVRVQALRSPGRRGRFATALRLIVWSWRLRHDYDAVFVHMTMENILVAGWLWRLLGKRIVLWYTHGTVSWRLRLAIPFTHAVLTASPESMRVPTPKKHVMGHGIDLTAFTPVPPAPGHEPVLLTVGRVAPVKRINTLIDAVALLKERGVPATLLVIGGGESSYVETLRAQARAQGVSEQVQFLGSMTQAQVRGVYAKAHVFVHASETGSIDKAPLEALAVGMPVVTSNQELARAGSSAIRAAAGTADSFADRIQEVYTDALWQDADIREAARTFVADHYDLGVLIPRILAQMAPVPHGMPMLASTRDTRDHFNRVAKEHTDGSYEERRWQLDARVKEQFEATQSFVRSRVVPELASANRIIELGPGPGTWTAILASARPDAHFSLTDISAEMLERAKAQVPGTVDLYEGDFESVALPLSTADFFFSSRAIEYVTDKERAAMKIAGLLSHNGRGCVITKMPKSLQNRLTGRKPSALHQGQIRPRDLARAFRNAGLVDVRLYPVTLSVPFLRSAAADRLARTFFARMPLNPVSAFFAESYAVQFRKP